MGIVIAVVIGWIKLQPGPDIYDNLKTSFEKAMKTEDYYKAETLLSQLKKMDTDLKKCLGCEKQLKALELKIKFMEAVKAGNISEAESLLSQLRILNNLKNCPDCEQQLETVKSQVEKEEIEIVLPEAFGEIDLSDRIELDGCKSVKLIPYKKRLYITRCLVKRFPKVLKIPGFDEISISPAEDGKLRPETEQFKAYFQLSLSDDSIAEYTFKDKEIRRGEKQEVSLSVAELGKTFKIQTLKPENRDCNIQRKFTIQEALEGREIVLEPLNVDITILMPDEFRDTDLSDKMEFSPKCESVRRKPDTQCTYIAECRRCNIPNTLKINGFKDISQLSFNVKRENRIEPEQLTAVFQISTPTDEVVYSFKDVTIRSGENKIIEIILPDLRKKIEFISNISVCNDYRKFTVKEALEGKVISLIPPCKKTTITYPKSFNSPETLDKKAVLISNNGDGTLKCFHNKNKGITLSWGKGWNPVEIPAEVLKQSDNYEITLDKFAPVWPFASDEPLFDTKRDISGKDPCTTLPVYTPFDVQYCRDAIENYCSPEIQIEGKKLPDLRKAEWQLDAPLPAKTLLRLKRSSDNPMYEQFPKIPWNISNKGLDDLTSLINKKYIQALPVRIQIENILYNPNAKLIFFSDKYACVQWKPNVEASDFMIFSPGFLKNLKIPPCTSPWAMVVKGNKRLTPCTRIEPDKNGYILKLIAEKIEGKRLLIVIANSKILSESGRGKAIQKAMIEWLKSLKESSRYLPVNIIVIKGDKEVREILTGEKLARLPFESQDTNIPSIVGTIYGNLTFTGDGFRPLRVISSVKRQMRNKQIAKILFFTDSYYLPEFLNDSDIGTLIGWKEDGIRVTIVTESNCERWQTIKELFDCRVLGQYPEVKHVSQIFESLK